MTQVISRRSDLGRGDSLRERRNRHARRCLDLHEIPGGRTEAVALALTMGGKTLSELVSEAKKLGVTEVRFVQWCRENNIPLGANARQRQWYVVRFNNKDLADSRYVKGLCLQHRGNLSEVANELGMSTEMLRNLLVTLQV